MKDELLGKYFTSDLADRLNNKDNYNTNMDHKTLGQAQKALDSVELLKQMEAIDAEKALLKVKTRITKRKGLNYSFLMQKAAAVLLLPLIAMALWQGIQLHKVKSENYFTLNQLSTPPTLRSFFELPDGTKVWLNGSSTLKYPTQFAAKERMVELDGEAYFEVKPDTQHPFMVKTGGILVEAVGTAFNIKSFSAEQKNEVLLTEGAVNILLFNENRRKTIGQLTPNQLFSLNKSDFKYTIKNVDPKKHIAWRDGKLIFHNDDLSEMLSKLERWYNVEFIFDTNLNTAYSFTGSFAGDDLTKILDCIELTTPVKFDIQQMSQDSEQYYIKTKINVKQQNNK